VLTPALVEVAPCVNEAVGWFREAQPKRPIEFVAPDAPLVILSDRDRFQQAVSSLLDHLSRITPSDSAIRIALGRRQDRAALTMSAARPPYPSSSRRASSATKSRSFNLAVLFAQALWMRFAVRSRWAMRATAGPPSTRRFP